jgi:O-acetylhomoserine (thiol)-lyase
MDRDTLCVQGGYTPANGEPRQIPIIQSTTFKYDTSEDMGKLFDLEASGLLLFPPPEPDLRLCGGEDRRARGRHRGHAHLLRPGGELLRVFNIASCGDHIVSSSSIYGGTFNLISRDDGEDGRPMHLRGPRTAPPRSWRPPSAPTPRPSSARRSPTPP